MSGLRDLSNQPLPSEPTDRCDASWAFCVCVPEPCDVSPRAPTPKPGGPEPNRVAQRRRRPEPPRGCRSLRYWATTTRPRVRPSHVRRSGTRPRVRSGWLRPWMLRACSSSAPARQWTTAPRRSRPTRARAFSLAASTRPVACERGRRVRSTLRYQSMLDRPRRSSDKHAWPAGPRSPPGGCLLTGTRQRTRTTGTGVALPLPLLRLLFLTSRPSSSPERWMVDGYLSSSHTRDKSR
jgi:hypothetical protein